MSEMHRILTGRRWLRDMLGDKHGDSPTTDRALQFDMVPIWSKYTNDIREMQALGTRLHFQFHSVEIILNFHLIG